MATTIILRNGGLFLFPLDEDGFDDPAQAEAVATNLSKQYSGVFMTRTGGAATFAVERGQPVDLETLDAGH